MEVVCLSDSVQTPEFSLQRWLLGDLRTLRRETSWKTTARESHCPKQCYPRGWFSVWSLVLTARMRFSIVVIQTSTFIESWSQRTEDINEHFWFHIGNINFAPSKRIIWFGNGQWWKMSLVGTSARSYIENNVQVVRRQVLQKWAEESVVENVLPVP